MSRLTVRHIDFEFPDEIPFQWNPGNPGWGHFVNYVTLIAPAFERYFIKATRAALPQITNPAVREDADLFCRQEAQHSKHHLAHLEMLIRKHPGLRDTHEAIMASYDRLYRERSLDFHLSYAATVELCFGPVARFVIENREPLFRDSDPRIASFMLWHLVEEFEHRNAAIDVYKAVVGSHTYRLRTAPAVKRHLAEIEAITRDGLERHVPVAAGELGAAEVTGMFDEVPRRERLRLIYELACTLLPYHKPDNLKQPDWVTRWFADEAAGRDMRLYYPG